MNSSPDSVARAQLSRRRFLGASLAVAGGVAGSSLLSACGSSSGSGGSSSNEVVVLGWDTYVNSDIVKIMAAAGLNVTPVPAATDQEMFTKIKAGGGSAYDVVFCNCGWSPSYYKAGLVEAFDAKAIKGHEEIWPVFLEDTSLPYVVDPYKVTMFPNTFDSYALIWDLDAAYQPTPPYSWQDLWSDQVPDGKVVMRGGAEDFLAIAGLALGVPKGEVYSMTGAKLQEAAQHLGALKPFQIAPADDILENALVSGKATIGVTTQLAMAPTINGHEGREATRAVIPAEGSIGWIDGPQIVKDAKHRDNAMKFIEVWTGKEIQDYLWTTYGFSPCDSNKTKSILASGGDEAQKLKNLGGDTPDNATKLVYQGPPKDPAEWAKAYDTIVGS